MNTLTELCTLLDNNAKNAQKVIDSTKQALKDWDIDKAIAEGKKQVELLRAGYTPSQVLKMM